MIMSLPAGGLLRVTDMKAWSELGILDVDGYVALALFTSEALT
jgi:hypothetical protein